MKIFNKYTFDIIFLILFILSIVTIVECEGENQNNVIIIHFKSFFPKDDYSPNESKSLINSWIRRKLYLEIENKSGQKLPFIINLKIPEMHINNVVSLIREDDERYYKPYIENISNFCNFDYHNSDSYELTTNFNYSFHYITNTCYAKEKVFFYSDLNLNEKKLYEIEFVHSTNETSVCFFSGLLLTDSIAYKKSNFLNQLKHLINSKSYSWALKFDSPDEGELIFGDIKGNKNLKFYNDNSEDNYKSYQVQTYSEIIYWKLYFEKIYFGDYVIQTDTRFYFNIDIHKRYIAIPKEHFNQIRGKYYLSDDNYTSTDSEKKFICFEDDSQSFHSIYCNKKEFLELTDNYKKLPDLNLFGFNFGFNITFTAKELFLEKDDKVYFLIGYSTKSNFEWEMGNVFLEKYITIFDNDAKLVSILKRNDKSSNEDDNNRKENNLGKIIIIIILIFILSGLIFGFLGIFFGKKYFQSRKKKANELNDDDYDYSPNSINVEENQNSLLDSK